MNKYIKEDKFRALMYHKAFEEESELQKWDSGCWIRYKLFEQALDEMPSADVRENIHGKWIDESGDSLKCSVCGMWVYKPFVGGSQSERTRHYAPNYCAFCGADMRERKKDE